MYHTFPPFLQPYLASFKATVWKVAFCQLASESCPQNNHCQDDHLGMQPLEGMEIMQDNMFLVGGFNPFEKY